MRDAHVYSERFPSSRRRFLSTVGALGGGLAIGMGSLGRGAAAAGPLAGRTSAPPAVRVPRRKPRTAHIGTGPIDLPHGVEILVKIRRFEHHVRSSAGLDRREQLVGVFERAVAGRHTDPGRGR